MSLRTHYYKVFVEGSGEALLYENTYFLCSSWLVGRPCRDTSVGAPDFSGLDSVSRSFVFVVSRRSLQFVVYADE